MAKTPAISDVENLSVGHDVKRVLGQMKEIIEVREGRRGTRNSRAVTIQDLIDAGIILDGVIL